MYRGEAQRPPQKRDSGPQRHGAAAAAAAAACGRGEREVGTSRLATIETRVAAASRQTWSHRQGEWRGPLGRKGPNNKDAINKNQNRNQNNKTGGRGARTNHAARSWVPTRTIRQAQMQRQAQRRAELMDRGGLRLVGRRRRVSSGGSWWLGDCMGDGAVGQGVFFWGGGGGWRPAGSWNFYSTEKFSRLATARQSLGTCRGSAQSPWWRVGLEFRFRVSARRRIAHSSALSYILLRFWSARIPPHPTAYLKTFDS